MITKFKIFENINESEPEVGDYVIVDITVAPYKNLSNELLNRIDKINQNICKITEIKTKPGTCYILNNYWYSSRSDIKCWSKNKEELEPILLAKKYNI